MPGLARVEAGRRHAHSRGARGHAVLRRRRPAARRLRRRARCRANQILALIDAAAAAIAANADELTRLDQAIGDGDHGSNMARGFQAIAAPARGAGGAGARAMRCRRPA